MKQIFILILLCSLTFYGVVKNSKNRIDNMVRKSDDSILYLSNHTTSSLKLENISECQNHIYFYNNFPTFGFENDFTVSFSSSFLIDTLFDGFMASYLDINIDNTLAGKRKYIQFEIYEQKKTSQNIAFTEKNTFNFHIKPNGYCEFEFAEINSVFKNQVKRTKWFSLSLDSVPINIGMLKTDFSNKFIGKTLSPKDIMRVMCDTISVIDDSSSSLFFFKDDRLNKIIVTPYVH